MTTNILKTIYHNIFTVFFKASFTLFVFQFLLLLSGSAGVHFLLAAVPEVEQSVVLVGTKVGEVSEQAVSEPLVTQYARPPGFGQHSVVGPVVTDPLLGTEWPLAVRCGGVSATALLPAGVLPLRVRQLQEHGAWWETSRAGCISFTVSSDQKAFCVVVCCDVTNLLRECTGACSQRGN